MNIELIIKSIVEEFKNVKGVEGIVLGGSRATKTENEMYCLNEKGSLDRLIKSDNVRIPMGFKETIEKSKKQ